MKIEEIMNERCIYLDQDLNSKEEVFRFLSKILLDEHMIENQEEYLKKVYERETLSDTGLIDGIAIPHGVSEAVCRPCVAFVRLTQGIEWETIDGNKVKYVFLLAIPAHSTDNLHIKMISELACSLMKPQTIQGLKQIQTPKQMLALLTKGGQPV